MVTELRNMIKSVKDQTQDRLEQKTALLKELTKNDIYPTITDKEDVTMFPFILKNGEPIDVRGIDNTKAHVFKSAKKPFLLYLMRQSTDGISEFPIILKFNDDVRNDVMIMQLFNVIDSQL